MKGSLGIDLDQFRHDYVIDNLKGSAAGLAAGFHPKNSFNSNCYELVL